MSRHAATIVALTLLATGSAVAGSALVARPDAALTAGGPATTNTDDSCDIGVYPAATLLLPYFEVDLSSPQATALTTLFTVVNVTRFPQIAHCTVWTDWAFPVLDFSILLTGYDVQAINLYDILARGVIAPPGGTSNGITPGSLSAANNANPNFAVTAASTCSQLPGLIPSPILKDVQAALTTGVFSSCGSSKVGGVHKNALGYVTIDVSSTCSQTLPTSSSYYTNEILFDNALTGDYEQIDPNSLTGNYAGGNPLVHIRAVPEGGPAGSIPGTNLPYTFYDRYTNQLAAGVPRTIDRRQPLPSSFAARYIEAGRYYPGSFSTNYKIWREGLTGAGAACNAYTNNSKLLIPEIVRFDEHELAQSWSANICILTCFQGISLSESSATPTSASTFPPLSSPSGDLGGWMYLNLNDRSRSCTQIDCPAISGIYSAARPGFSGGPQDPDQVRPSQNWVIVSMSAEGRYSVDFDATSLGNGCSLAAGRSSETSPAQGLGPVMPIGPAGGVPVCPPRAICTPGSSYTGTNVTP